MKRFLSTTAILMSLAGTAMADAHMAEVGTVKAQQGDFYASNLIGMRVYNSENAVDSEMRVAAGAEQEWDDIGEINDIIVSKDGEVRAVILGVGGFLGMGERDVSISMDEITVLNEEGEGNERFLVVSTSKEALENAPVFERLTDNMGEAMNETEETATNLTEEVEAETQEATSNVEAETEELANETEEMASNVETETEELANETEQMAENAEAQTEEMANDAETVVTTNETDATAETETTEMAEGDRTMLTRPQVERDGYAEVEMAEIGNIAADQIEGSYVYGANDETVGEIDALLLDDNGNVSQVVVNVGGFLGLGEKPVAVSFEELQILRAQDGGDIRIYIDSTEEALEAQPEYQQ